MPVGLLAAAILVVNNVRDIDSDRRAGKRTLAVKLGRERTRVMFAAIVYAAYPLALVTWLAGPLTAWVALSWLSLPLAAALVADRPHPDRRALAERRAGPQRDAAAVLLRAAVGRAAAQPVRRPAFVRCELSAEPLSRPLRVPFAAGHGTVTDARSCSSPWRPPTA